MTVADLNFSLGVSGEREVERSLETIEDGLEDAQDAAERLDDKDPDVDVDADMGAAKQKIQAALNTVRVLDDKDANIDVRADGVQETIAEGVAAAQRLDDLEADIDLETIEGDLETIEDGLEDAQDAAERLNDRDPDVDVDADVGAAVQKIQAALGAVKDLDNEQADVEVKATGASQAVAEAATTANTIDGLDAAISTSASVGETKEQLDLLLEQARQLDRQSPDVEVDADVADEQQKLQAALNTVRALNSKDANIDVDADGVQETIAEGVAAAQRLDDLEADIDLDVDRDGLRRAVSGLDDLEADIDLDVDRDGLQRAVSGLPSSGGGGGRRDRVRLPGELDEVQDAARAFGRLSPQIQALSGAVVAATGALAGAGGLVGAATALATRIGDVQLRRDLRSLKQQFRSVGQSFVTAFEPLIRDQIIPAGEALARKLEAVIPELVTFTENNLPDLSSAVTTLVEAVVNTAKVLGFVSRALGVLVSSIQLFADLLKGPQVESATDVSGVINEDAQAELTDIFQGFGFGGESIGFGSLTFNVPQTELRQSLQDRDSSNFGGGSRPSVARGGGDVPVTEDIRKIQRQIAVARQKFQRLESFTKKDLLKALKKLRTKGLESLLMLEEKTGMSLDRTQEYEAALERVNGKLKRLKASNALEQLAKETKQAADATKVPSAAEVAADNGVEGTTSIGSKIPDQVSGIPNAQRKINVLKQRLKEVSAFGRRATGILRQGFLRVGDAIGASLVNSIAQGKSAIQGLRSVFSSVIQSLISQLAGLAVKLGVIVPLLGALGLGTGGAAIPAATGLPGAGLTEFLPGAASGGFVEEGGLARIHKGETIIPKGGGMAAGQLDAGTASLNGDTIEIPVRMINDGNRIGSRNKGRAGRA